jgi:twitching motility protein PilT
VSAQLFQLLTQLDRPGATELVIATGRQVAVRVNSTYQTLTASAVSLPQLMHLIRETQLAAMVPASEKVGDPVAVDLDGRALRAQFIRQGTDVMLRIEHRPAPQAPARPTPVPAVRAAPMRAIEVVPGHTPTPPPDAALIGRAHRTSDGPLRSPPIREVTPALPFTRDGYPVRSEVTPALPFTRDGYPVREVTPAVPFTREGYVPSREPPPPREPPPRELEPRPRPAPVVTAGDERAELIDEPSEIASGLAALVTEARRREATDLHIAANRPVSIRTVGELVALDPAPRSAEDVERLLMPLLGPARRRQLVERGYVDLAVDIRGAGRLRTNISRQQGGLKGAFRLMMARPPTLAELGLPAQVAKVTEHHQGLVVIAGPSGHGKTTTLAALVDLLNRADPIHILTIEDPVEIVHPKHAAVVSQREVGRHTLSFAAALKASLREDPDVIVIGELRDRETVEIALTAAETGHLVLATMSTPSAAKTIDRLIDMFPPADQSQVRASLGAALKAIVAQRMLPNAPGTGVVVAVELLVGMLALANMIRDNKLFQLPNLMQRGKSFGMIRLDDSLADLVRAGKLTEDVAVRYADSKKELLAALHPVAPEPVKRGLFGRKDRE